MKEISIKELSQKTGLLYSQIYLLIKKNALKSVKKVKVGKKFYYLFDEDKVIKELEDLKNNNVFQPVKTNIRINLRKI